MNRTKTMLALVGAALMTAGGFSAFADPTVMIDSVTENGKWSTIDVAYTLSGLDTSVDYKVSFGVTADGVMKATTNAATKLENKSYTKTIDTKTLFGAARRDAKAKVKVAILPAQPDVYGGQLWEGGPYFAACNLGASKPEEYGYYFWWGDTVGYKWSGSSWVSAEDNTTIISFSTVSGTSAQTYGKSDSALTSGGWIGDDGNLAAGHDAARAYLGGDWRMPTSDEMKALADKCNRKWTTRNGVKGWLITGRGAYEFNGIFLPAVGYGYDSSLNDSGSNGRYWSSTPGYNSNGALGLVFSSSSFGRDSGSRCGGYPVRPVR